MVVMLRCCRVHQRDRGITMDNFIIQYLAIGHCLCLSPSVPSLATIFLNSLS